MASQKDRSGSRSQKTARVSSTSRPGSRGWRRSSRSTYLIPNASLVRPSSCRLMCFASCPKTGSN
eukprot:5122973-Prymnesium_polylepis.2